MAENFDVVGVVPTQRLVNGTQLSDVIELTGVTKPHGVMFTVEAAKAPGWKDAILAAAEREAAELESVFGL